MPKFIGNTIDGSREIDTAPQGATLVKLSYSQAVKLPATEVYYELDTSDRGSRRSLAKRWHRWYAAVEAIESCAASTVKMRAAASMRRTRALSTLIANLRNVAQHVQDQHVIAMRPLRLLGLCLRDAAASAHLAALGIVATLIESESPTVNDADRRAARDVAADALADVGGPREIIHVLGPVARAIARNPEARPGDWAIRNVGWRS